MSSVSAYSYLNDMCEKTAATDKPFVQWLKEVCRKCAIDNGAEKAGSTIKAKTICEAVATAEQFPNWAAHTCICVWFFVSIFSYSFFVL